MDPSGITTRQAHDDEELEMDDFEVGAYSGVVSDGVSIHRDHAGDRGATSRAENRTPPSVVLLAFERGPSVAPGHGPRRWAAERCG